ncbi:hypothetical protein BV20DRAFT_5422 [Pilatotrama ljubarskyi]|nr:hypothetical protein BV20DRAFT_5422 [Pilatotrama ljubarskyi]
MRRIAAVFASKRSDRSDAASSTAASSNLDHSSSSQKQSSTVKPHTRFFRSISRKSKPVDPILNHISSSDLHPPSSSSSSSGAPTTPDDDHGSLLRAPVSKAWHSLPHPVDPHTPSPSHHLPGQTAPHDRAPFHSSPPTFPTPSSQSTLDTEDDSSEESSVAPDLSRPPERAAPPLDAPAYLLTLTSNSLRPPFAPPPLLHVPACPLYPRSSNPRRALSYRDSLESTLHRTRLQRRLQRGDLTPSERRSIASFAGRRAAPRDRPSLLLDDNAVDHTHVKPFSAGLRKWADRPCFEDRLQVLLAENLPPAGLDADAELPWTRVAPATGFGVAALEYSVALEMLAGLYEEEAPGKLEPRGSEPDPVLPLDFLRLDTQLSLELAPPLSQSPTTASPSTSSEPQSPASSLSPTAPASAPAAMPSMPSSSNTASASRNHHYKANPSPLRMEATSSSPASTNVVTSPASSATAVDSPKPPQSIPSPPASAPPVPLKSALKQGVRFVEGEKDDREDSVPLGYVQRIKQKREEKARFLQVERERRKLEEERRKHEEERRRWEEERAAWEREKRAMEEERKKRMYAEEIAAARSRRESQRFGALGAATGESLATGQWDRTERARPERESSSTSIHTRPVYDPASQPPAPVRQGSDSSTHLPRSATRSGGGSGSGSPSGSRPGSVYGSANVSGSSRPPSMYTGLPTPSSSQQDVRLRERRTSGSGSGNGTGSRRGSMVSENSGSHRRAEPVPVPPMPHMWAMGMNMQPMQPMPAMGMAVPMPMYAGMDMPLLPPSPPFMMQQYGYRPPSQNSNRHSQHSPQRSHSSSPTLGRQSLPGASSSSERVNRLSQAHPGASSSASARAPSLPRSESSPHRSGGGGHHRTSSGDHTQQRPSAGVRSHSDDRRSMRSGSERPAPVHSSSLPSHPPPAFNQARQSWAMPKPATTTGFENVSRPAQGGGRRQTVYS